MTDLLLTPRATDTVVELSRTRFRKRILPRGSINYQGRQINFDAEYLANLARSFHEGAYDQVPVMLADKDNSHTLAVERFGGEITDVEVEDDGLYAVLDLQPAAAEIVRQNPKLGVSAGLRLQDDRADGRRMGMAIGHVLATLDPRVTGLGPWEEIALSRHDPDARVIDLTHATYTEGGPAVADSTTTETASEADERVPFRTRLRRALGMQDDTQDDGVTDEELAELIAESVGEGEQPLDAEPQLAGASLSHPAAPAPTAIDLAARAELDEHRTQLAEMRDRLAAERYATERGEYVRRGVPPALVELARPLLASADPVTVDLSNGIDTKVVDAGAIARQMLDSMAGYIDLARERGHGFAPEPGDDDTAEQDRARALADEWGKQFGA